MFFFMNSEFKDDLLERIEKAGLSGVSRKDW